MATPAAPPGLPLLLSLLLLACRSEAVLESDTDPEVAASEGWTLGEPLACDAAAVGWSEAPLEVETHAPPEGYVKKGWDGGGGVALVPVEGHLRLYWNRHDGGDAKGGSVGVRDLQGGLLPDAPLADVNAFALGDLDGDGLLDLVAAAEPLQVLFAAGTAAEEVVSYPPVAEGEIRDVAVGDLDGDGLEDLYVALTADPNTAFPAQSVPGQVWLNQGDRTFSVVATAASDPWWGRPFDARVQDRDGDGDLDVYLCNDPGTGGGPSAWFDNPGDGHLVGLEGELVGATGSCMGQDWGDVDGDGTLDLLIADAIRPFVFVDEGAVDASQALEVPVFSSFSQMGWGGRLADFDADGALDLAIASGDFWYDGAAGWPLMVAMQQGGTFGPTLGGLPELAHGHGLVVADTDGDGGLDLVLGDAVRSPWLLRSHGCPEAAWLDVAAPHGTVVRVEAGDREHLGLISTDSSYASAGPAVVRVGLGSAEAVDAVVLAVPNVGEVRLDGPFAPRRLVRWAASESSR